MIKYILKIIFINLLGSKNETAFCDSAHRIKELKKRSLKRLVNLNENNLYT